MLMMILFVIDTANDNAMVLLRARLAGLRSARDTTSTHCYAWLASRMDEAGIW